MTAENLQAAFAGESQPASSAGPLPPRPTTIWRWGKSTSAPLAVSLTSVIHRTAARCATRPRSGS